MPAYSTGIDSGENIREEWQYLQVRDGAMKKTIAIDRLLNRKWCCCYSGLYRCHQDGYVTISPLTPYDKWDGEKG